MDSPPLDNRTEFLAHPQLLLGKDGEKLVIMVKATWELAAGATDLELAPKDRTRGLRPVDVPWGEPAEEHSVAFPGDFCIRKPGTDVVVVARGYAPSRKPVEQFDVSVHVGPLSKVLRVFGLRVWQGGGSGISDPQTIAELDLRYEYAWGGAEFDEQTGRVAEEARNPVGRGVALDPDTLTHTEAPQIEDPFDLISSHRSRPGPAGVGAIARHWEPRRSFAGTYDEAWLDERAPLVPADEDDRINLCASPGLVAQTPLVGGEQVVLSGLSPGGGAVEFRLPRVRLGVRIDVHGRPTELFSPHLDTVVIDQLFGTQPGLPTVETVWRAAVNAPPRMKDARIVITELEAP